MHASERLLCPALAWESCMEAVLTLSPRTVATVQHVTSACALVSARGWAAGWVLRSGISIQKHMGCSFGQVVAELQTQASCPYSNSQPDKVPGCLAAAPQRAV